VLFPQNTAAILKLPARRAGPETPHLKWVKASLLLLHSHVWAILKVMGQNNTPTPEEATMAVHSSKTLSLLPGMRTQVHSSKRSFNISEGTLAMGEDGLPF